MKFLNKTRNSVYLEDISLHIPYISDEEEHSISLDDVKKSFSFQNMVVCGAFDIAQHEGSRIETNLIRLAKKKVDEAPEVVKEEEPRMPSGESPEVIIKGHFYEAGGYAKVNRNLAMGLASVGVKTEISPINSKRNDLNELEVRALSQLKKKVGSKAIRIDSVIPTFGEISPRASYRILYTTVEAASVPEQIVQVCNQYDEVWVTSDFCKDVLSKGGCKKSIFVMPPGVQTKLYNENAEPHIFRPSLKPFVFCSVFGWSYRKGNDALLKSYIDTFSADDPVTLLIVSRFQYMAERSGIIKTEIDKFVKQSGKSNPPHIVRCSRVIPEYEMPRIYRACNAFVLPTRGEGFGLPYCEASLCGLPCIATNHSGQTMFLKGHNSVLVDIDRMEKVQRGTMHVHYWDEQMFPSLKSPEFIKNLGGAMRDVFECYDEAKERNALLQKEIIDNYSFSVSANRAKKRLDEIWQQLK
jgi:glycosyltransferase involved in cell wall biosynthesis